MRIKSLAESKGEFRVIDLAEAGSAEVVIKKNPGSLTSSVWVNVDGICILRIGKVSIIVTDINTEDALRLTRE